MSHLFSFSKKEEMEQFSFKSSYKKSVTLFKSTIVVIHN